MLSIYQRSWEFVSCRRNIFIEQVASYASCDWSITVFASGYANTIITSQTQSNFPFDIYAILVVRRIYGSMTLIKNVIPTIYFHFLCVISINNKIETVFAKLAYHPAHGVFGRTLKKLSVRPRFWSLDFFPPPSVCGYANTENSFYILYSLQYNTVNLRI